MNTDDAIRKLSAPWTCYGCGRTFIPTPTKDFPVGRKVSDPDKNGKRQIIGDLCADCMKPKQQ